MALYQNFTTSQNGTITIPGPIIGTHSNNTIANIYTTNGNVGIGLTNPAFTLDVNGTVDAVTYTGANINISGSIQAGGNIGAIGNLTNGGYDFILGNANQVARGNSGASRALVKDGAASLKINFAGDFTGGTEVQGSSLSHAGFFSASGNSNTLGNLVTTGGNIGIGIRTPTQIMHIQRSGSDNYLKIDAGGGASNLSGIMLSEHNINFGWSLRHDAGTDLLYISYQDNTPSFTNTTIFNRSGQIGINKTPGYTLDINGGRLNLHNAAGTGGGQNLFEGLENTTIRAQIVLSSMYSDLVIASSQANDVHGSTLTFASYNPSNKADYRKWVINQGNWGARVHMLEFGYNPNNIPNPHDAANDTYTVMTLDGVNDRVGISNRSPGFKLDVNGDFRAYGGRYIIQNSQDGGTGRGIYMWNEADTNWAIYMGTSGAGRSFNGGTAPTGVYGFSSHAMRFRTYHNPAAPNNGWIFENGSEGHAASIRGDGHMYIAGNLGIGTVSPSYKLHVSGDTLTNGWFRTTGDTGLWSDTYSRGMRVAVTGEYGSIETHGTGKNNWEGFSIDGRYVFMSADNNQCGIYNDVDNNWIMYFDRSDTGNRYCQLRHNDVGRLVTTSYGVYVSSRVTVDAGSGTAGYYFSENPGGGGGDAAWIKYYARSGESTNLEIGISNDGDDNIFLNATGGVGIGLNNPSAKLDVAGGSGQSTAIIRDGSTNAYQSAWPGGWGGGLATWDINCSGIYYGGLTQRSDIRKKKDIETYTRGLYDVIQLRPVTFKWKDNNETEKQFGFIAQEVEQIIPEIVGEDSEGYKNIKNAYVPLLVNAIKELNTKVEESKTEINNLKAENSHLKSQIQQIFTHLGLE